MRFKDSVEIQAEAQMVLDSIMNRSSRDTVGRGRDRVWYI
jgi:hypothetical protein